MGVKVFPQMLYIFGKTVTLWWQRDFRPPGDLTRGVSTLYSSAHSWCRPCKYICVKTSCYFGVGVIRSFHKWVTPFLSFSFLRVPLPQLRNMIEDAAQTLKFMYGSLDRWVFLWDLGHVRCLLSLPLCLTVPLAWEAGFLVYSLPCDSSLRSSFFWNFYLIRLWINFWDRILLCSSEWPGPCSALLCSLGW